MEMLTGKRAKLTGKYKKVTGKSSFLTGKLLKLAGKHVMDKKWEGKMGFGSNSFL